MQGGCNTPCIAASLFQPCPALPCPTLRSAVLGDLGLSLVKLGKYEDEEGSKCGQYSELGVGARSIAADARRVGLAAVRHSRLARAANSQAMEALEPLHDELAMSPVRGEGLGKVWACGAHWPRSGSLLYVHVSWGMPQHRPCRRL